MEERKIAIIMVSLKYGLATICIAGGLGMAMAFERI